VVEVMDVGIARALAVARSLVTGPRSLVRY
jgi:hypothetical protein